MKRLITFSGSALAAIAIASPLFASDAAVGKTATTRDQTIVAGQPSGERSASGVQKQASNKASPSPAKGAAPGKRVGAGVNMHRAPRLEELRKNMSAAPAPGPATRTVPNILVPDRLKNLQPKSQQSAQFASAAAPRQRTPGSGQTPAVKQSFGGYDSDDNAALFGFRIMPPDTQGDVGREHYVQWNNLGFKIFLKDGTLLNGPNGDPGNIFWAGSGGSDCEVNNDGDPIVLYDHVAHRWVFTQFQIGPGLACFAISDGEDPAGPYTTWEFPISLAGFNDYPKMGLWVTEDGSQSAYHMTTNEFSPFLGVNLTAFDRDAILAGDPAASFLQFTLPPAARGAFALQPPNLEGPVLPPAGTCAPYIMAFDEEVWGDGTGVDGYRFWEFCADFNDLAIAPPDAALIRNACSGFGLEDVNTVLDDSAGVAVGDVCNALPPAIDAGPYRPAEPLSAFNGEDIAGAYVLTVADGFSFDTGILNTWCMIVNGGTPNCSSPGLAIPDADAAGVSDTITLADSGTITDLDVSIDTTHTWVGDLTFSLEKDTGVVFGSTLTEMPFVATTLPFDANLCDFAGCVPQPNGQRLDTLSQFTMYRFSVRMLEGKLTGAISHTVDLGFETDPGASSTRVIDIAGVESWDLAGDSSNTVLTVDLGGGSPITLNGIGWDVTLTTFGGSWLSEATAGFGPSGGIEVSVSPGAGDNFAGTASYSSGGVLDLTDNGIPNSGLPDGMLRIEFYESFDDAADAVDATWDADSTLTVSYNEGLPTTNLAGAQWAQFDLSGLPALTDTGIADGVLDDGLHRWMSSVSQDGAGNMAIGYSRSGAGPDDFPSVYYAGRESGDPAGTLQAESTCVDGTGSQEGAAARWGDYSTVSIDPADDCTFWITNEYVETTGSFQWDTQICSFQFASSDCDGDGVPNSADFCPGTVIPESVPTVKLGKNRWALTDDDNNFDTNGRNGGRSFTTEDTAGCSCEQIIEEQGLGKGHSKFGCSNGAMKNWVKLVNP